MGWVESMHRFTRSTLFLGLFSLANASLGIGEAQAGRGWQALLKPLLQPMWRRFQHKVNRKIDEFYITHCLPTLRREVRKGFYKLGSKRPQKVSEHIDAVAARFIREARRRRFSPDEINLGVRQIRIHEADEVVEGDQVAFSYKRLRSQRAEELAKNWEITEYWIPDRPGDVSPRWRDKHNNSRAAAWAFLFESVGPFWSRVLMPYYDAFHVGMDKVSVLARDCHYAETVEEGLVEGVEVHHFWLEANAAIADSHIRVELVNKVEKNQRQSKPEQIEV